MRLSKLIEQFDAYANAPIELTDIADALIELGIQDEIIFCKQDVDPGDLRGLYYRFKRPLAQFRQPTGAYSSKNVSLIIYSQHSTLAEQRVACAKELSHICDPVGAQPLTEQSIRDLADKVIGPLNPSSGTETNLAATLDTLGEYRAYALLVPEELAGIAKKKLTDGASIEALADWLAVPEDVVETVTSDRWAGLRAAILAI